MGKKQTAAEKRAQLTQELLESDDDDDDLLLAKIPTFSRKPSPPVSQTTVEEENCDTPEYRAKILERAQRIAAEADLWLVDDICSPHLIRWYRAPKNNVFYPCAIRENLDEAQGLSVGLTKTRPVLIQYLGRVAPYTGQRDAAAASRLLPATMEEPKKKNMESNKDCQTENSVKDDDGSKNIANGSNTPQWDPEKMERLLKELRKMIPFDESSNIELDLQVERLVLERLLAKVYANQKEEEEKKQKSMRKQSSAPTNDEGDKERTVLEKFGSETKDSGTSPSVAADAEQSYTRRILEEENGTLMDAQKAVRIRAGDEIRYYVPLAHRTPDNLRQAWVLEAYPRPHNIALVLSNSAYLPRDTPVKLVRRRVRGKLVDLMAAEQQQSHYYTSLEQCSLDKSQNGKWDHLRDTKMEDMVDRMKAAHSQAESEFFGQKKGHEDDTNNDNDNADNNDNDQSRPDAEAMDKNGQSGEAEKKEASPLTALEQHNVESGEARVNSSSTAIVSPGAVESCPIPPEDAGNEPPSPPPPPKQTTAFCKQEPKIVETATEVVVPEWKSRLLRHTEDVCEQKKKRRYDFRRVAAQELHLQIAQQVWETVGSLQMADCCVNAMQERFEIPNVTTHNYLTGDDKFFSTPRLEELNEQFEEFLLSRVNGSPSDATNMRQCTEVTEPAVENNSNRGKRRILETAKSGGRRKRTLLACS